MQSQEIILRKVRVHNLKEVDLTLKRGQLIVFTGVSGSGKSSLAFDTIYVEGQRRYIESLSTYARRHLGDMPKPDAELISGISPTIAIEQKTSGRNPRSTVGTITGIYDFLRVLFARVGIPHCPISGEPVTPQSTQQIILQVQKSAPDTRLLFLSPYARGKKAEFKEEFADLLRKGFTRVRLDGNMIDLEEEIAIDGNVAHDVDLLIDRFSLQSVDQARLAEAVTQALEWGKGVMSVMEADTGVEVLYSQHAFSKKSGESYGPLEPHDFSFNHPSGMCPTCQGLGTIQEFDLNLIIDPKKSIAEDACSVASSYKTVRYGNIYDNLARLYKFDINTPWEKLPQEGKKAFLYGIDAKWTRMQFFHLTKGSRWTEFVHWKGVLHEARIRYQEAKSELYRSKMQELMQQALCPSCHGEKIRPYPAATLFGGQRIAAITALPVSEALTFFQTVKLTQEEQFIAEELLKEICERLTFLQGVGLHYLTMDRTAPTLSGGESQRVRLASQIGSGLVGATYILDEPSIGLHPRDNLRLLETLRRLRSLGNTVIVVEHDEETIREADYIVDVGPLAGELGGRIVAQGSLQNLVEAEESITGAYLSGRKSIAIPKKRRTLSKHALQIEKATHHNLKGVSVKIPLGGLIAVTGVSGSGKSSLITDILYPALSNHLMGSRLIVGAHEKITGMDAIDKVIAIDQTPIGRTPRSNPSTYIKLFDEIRDLFSQLPESVAHGYTSGRFSFNVKEGSCPHCSGMGMVKIDMDFMEDEWSPCEHCKGKRFDEKTLSVHYKGKNIYEVLEMTVKEALAFFSALPKIRQKLEILTKVGLDYIRLGQPSPTVSGGEAQRIKLAKELSRPSTGKTFYILDEPTTGLHFHDIQKLINVLGELVDRGNTVLVIEHQMDLVKVADWIIDLGPEGGKGGGEILAEGRPEQIAKLKTPTGLALQHILAPRTATATEKMLPIEKSRGLPGIRVRGAAQNNLKQISVEIPRGKITVCTGPSGSGKSSFAFETIYAEGQRRYIESLSPYARQFVKQMPKPKVEQIEGLSAAIAIEQKSHAGNPRSTVGTMTEIYDFLRVLFAHLGTAYCPETGEEIRAISKEYVLNRLLALPEKTKVHVLAPLTKKEDFGALKERLQKEGFLRIRLNGKFYELDEEIPFDKQKKNALFLVIDRLMIQESVRSRLLEAIDQAASVGGNTLVVAAEEEDLFFNLAFAVESTGKSYPAITPHTFSFNTAQGMCPDCTGLGFQYGADLARHKEILELSPLGLIRLFWQERATEEALQLFHAFLKEEEIPRTRPLSSLEPQQLQKLLRGSETELSLGKLKLKWRGINAALAIAAKAGPAIVKQSILPLLEESCCRSCEGTRLNPLARHVKISGLSIADLCGQPIQEAHSFLSALTLPEEKRRVLDETLSQLKQRMYFLNAIGLHYLSLDRSAPSLSGGETQRIRLARQLGGGLTGCLYVLDEPTIGLHPHNNVLLNEALRKLCDLGNTLLLVEHDPLTVGMADYLLDFGPGAGKQGGRLVAEGTLKEILANPNSLTGAYLSGRKKIPVPAKRRKGAKKLQLKNGCLHNLKSVDVDFPLRTFTCLTGVSGSGKSTLMNDILRPAVEQGLSSRKDQVTLFGKTIVSGIDQIDKLLVLDQNPIGHTNRADVSTYVDLLSPLRTLFASLPLAKAKGLQPKNFSFNHKKGMCSACLGLGVRHVEMQFLPPLKVVCDKCKGFRLNPLSLEVSWKGKHLGEILQMNVEEALLWLPPHPKIVRILETLIAVGLGYLQIGQEIATLSGGEAQRLRLSRELAKRSTGKTLYLLDEPTIGLHSEDIAKLLSIFHALVDRGNSVILIEHNLDVMASADHLIDLGPEAGPRGGQIVATGTPEELAQHPTSLTARYLNAEHKTQNA